MGVCVCVCVLVKKLHGTVLSVLCVYCASMTLCVHVTYPNALLSLAGLFLPEPLLVLLLVPPPTSPTTCWPRDADSGDPSRAAFIRT